MEHVVFRLDATLKLASGHLMRCLTLATKLKESIPNLSVTFITGTMPENLSKLISAHHFIRLELPLDVDDSNWDQNTDIKYSQECLSDFNKVDLLIVDHYQLDNRWESAIKPFCHRLMVIDDLANRQHNCDILLDQTYGRTPEQYVSLVPSNCQVLLGQKYMLLRDEFAQKIAAAKLKRQQSSFIKNILVNLGGIDPNNATETLLTMLIELRKNALNIKVIMSADAPYLSRIKALISTQKGAELIIDCRQMAEQMLTADIAIGACGSSAWERCSLGLPTLAVVLAENQQDIASTLDKHDALINLGNINTLTSTKFIKAFKQIENNQNYQRMTHQAFKCCDGEGAKRVTQKLMASNAKLVKAQLDDLMTVYQWQSNPEIRQYSRQPKPVTVNEHQKWFTESLSNPTRHMFIIQKENLSVGVLRLDKLANTICEQDKQANYEVSILIAPEFQGQGLALQALLTIPEMFNNKGIYAFVNKQNITSQKLFKQANFYQINDEAFIRPAQRNIH